MSARILVVDDIEPNVRLLKAKLEAEYYEVVTASDGAGAIASALADQPDVILLDVMMPVMDGLEVSRRLRADPRTSHIPIVLLTALDGRRDRISGLEAGADEFLTKPVDDVSLFARVRSLTRLKRVVDDLRQREASGRRLGVIEGAASRLTALGARIIVADGHERQAVRTADELSADHRPVIEGTLEGAFAAAHTRADLVVVNLGEGSGFDGLRLVAQLKFDEATRHIPILAVVDAQDRTRTVKALELGVNDFLIRPIDAEELGVRCKTLIRWKRYTEVLRSTLDQSLELAVTDGLTGLHNRRYMASQAAALVRRATRGGDPVSALLVDIDHFKRINDTFGHDVGDEVLKEFAVRLATNVRAIDLACRYGGEEFVVVMPDTSLDDAVRIAERLRRHVSGSAFRVAGVATPLNVTISIGVACTDGEEYTSEALLKRADEGVYEAKAAGRNQVVARRNRLAA